MTDPHTNPVLQVEGISKSFGALKASDNVSIDLRPGEIHALIGPNGAGKSTLIKQISGSLRPDTGRIEVLGRDVTDLDTVARARLGLGRTFQISSLAMEFTVLQNVVLGALGAQGRVFSFFRNVMKDKTLLEPARRALERVGLQDEAQRRTADLSHGQRRQLEVAVALTLNPKLFLMDEPMAGLGASGSKTLTGFLDELRHEAPILLVEHDMDAVFALADRISVLVYGAVIATGTADEIRANPEVRRAYLGEEDAA
ncbi:MULTISPECIES: ABC transporter ATP-binding protein [Rhodobacterales]|jgi:branched-chain amino acid transport system ATP-binding protein|uniref:ABC transporter ATP-binding protein n=1 Tax=Rhodobacterales TaxID=204455 RepID=UPI00237FA0D4|nr:ABC transporter ATP-binding protein [Phaeobacter gallaeciensis]MDE4140456.1 ABC transporter ATP-binding protein [Phaeobacter gallaeciensis]MDE4148851.1 ABC transporter ATP-binding protein [Phaeobacter gallaeciensis]MDE4153073.1 ABC transporter ATP-binding protein [Phaeobacter gallaeciensis]MDE4228513.1 ABC transporter ATP-binding protein [Phaeobacter gallaeciensis]MDE4257589.1 ABC transporter ATP-binding protein [Phaeobacter gallaeciensis]